ncbi:O-unit flippase-like protein [Aquabacterium sp.]|uniref:O-unit flippase-like protein n=1 Tax=Aquabacterium sp. TaxID=1872578 RepID=UPI003B73766B
MKPTLPPFSSGPSSFKHLASQRSDVAWGYLAQFLNIGAGVLLLPAVLRYLPTEDVGLWFVFITLTSLAQLLEFGFQPTIARNTAYVFAGAQSLNQQGLPHEVRAGATVAPWLLADLVRASRAIYRIVAAIGGLVLLGGGSLYVMSVAAPEQPLPIVLGAWLLYAGGYVINFYYGYVNGLMQGRGDVVAASQVVIVTRASMLVAGVTALVTGAGLLGLGASTFLACILGRVVAMRFFLRGDISQSTARTGDTRDTMKLLWHNASRLGVVQIGAFLIQRANVLIASSFLGVGAAASFGMTVTLMMTLSGVAAVILQVRMPRLAAAQAARDMPALRALYGEVVVVAWTAFVAGALVLIFGGEWLLHLMGSKTKLLSPPLLALFGLVMLLEMNHSLAAGYLTTHNHVPFLRAGLFSGLLICVLSVAVVQQFDVIGLILAQGLVQLAYNNWKWPREARKDLGAGWSELIVLGMCKAIGKPPGRT